ncbi:MULTISPECIES: endonuclease MutS2 [unclassified Bacteroides]|uniref:endonuclease MutS2 n=1 Tax=unclassified Bacteroides TaxID=2646097 RepID=UPI000E9DA99C|nr:MULTISPECIES: Smr/MutS family protein [unclassified Bacteroides]RGN42834.1 endonuclease MutS2 [Bacteroides sp. OM05-12]RHR69971.1 endonuclease MutS2 [Bacteroides sp. AF16-49]
MIYPHNFEQKIGFDDIRRLLKEKCLSSLGEGRVDEMNFSDSFNEIEERLNQTNEFVRIIQEEDSFPAQYFFDVRPSLKRIRVEGMYLDEQELFDLRRSLETIRDIIRFLSSEDEEENSPYPNLKKLAGDIAVFPQLITRINGILNQYGKIKDNASQDLLRIRRELASTTSGISRSLNAILRSAQSEGYVDKDVAPTMRDGRLVIPVAPGLKRKIKGIVHDESSSGKTVFIEPAEVVEANNRIRELEGEERREIIRILTSFSDTLRPSVPDILQSYEFLAEVDFIRAKAYFALQTNSLKPALESEPLIDWTMAIHPLLQMSLAKHGKKVVPLDIELNSKQRILIISGPNAGGKSVCLKTVGLLQYMLQCGLLIPLHERSHAGIFGSIFIDIGDEQSIEDDLSTYSSHLTNMKIMMKSCDERSIILIDEFGGGTEPQIGGAIAEAVLKRFNHKKTFGVITTHYQNLKHFAEDHEGVVNGAMLYDRHLMQALFQLQIGNPGSSFAVEIARKIGLPEDVIADASAIVGSEYINADKYLQDIVRDKRYWEGKRQTIRQREKHMEEVIAKYEADIQELDKSRKEIIRKAKEDAERLLQESNAKIENTIRTIKEAQAEKEKTRIARQELNEFRESMEDIEKKNTEEKIARRMEKLREKQNRKKERKDKSQEVQSKPQTPKTESIEIGCQVKMKGQSSIGDVLEINGKNVVVAFGMIKTTVKLDRLERVKPSNSQPKNTNTKSTFVSSQTQDSVYEKKLGFKQDIDVRGMRGDEAIQAVTYFIDDAILLGIDRVRILHGTGTGILRTLIRDYLKTVPGIAHFQDEHVQFGGAGITVVDLS